MRVKRFVAVIAATLLAPTMMLPATAAPAAPRASGEAVALWDADFSPQMAPVECETWRLDERGFCAADDARNGVELGLKFQTARDLLVTGVRVYRVDLGTVTGSLWDVDGNRLATGTFAPAATTGWQDLTFAKPVAISPGRTYVASYYSPATRYAFAYGYFREQLVRGPVTALRGVADDPNGVHCYDVATQCESFPIRSFRDSTYWVTPIWQNPPGEAVPPQTVPAPPSDVRPPVVRHSSPTNGARRVGLRRSVTITFSEVIRSTLLTSANVRLLRKGQRKPVPVRLTYDERRARLTIDPVRRLEPSTTYRIVIATRVVDVAGNRLDQDPGQNGDQQATWRFRTR
ncbi:Ig-like domain-containing protein [Nocardioides alpinus]|uniref:Ig-like domain-containing protein n=1 Tax=Nocardioides alpinus TaxID=748909 RepID=A0A1I0ZF75_9ACTN|nr:DUF4082 domain-containing protein [Nocardioides alpinus]PKH40693.1 hypothetical protein CXG46_11945 [Nocardioides alpinus]SFB23180.1 Ig-like domain-containing protein [Nocardioides alpinus]